MTSYCAEQASTSVWNFSVINSSAAIDHSSPATKSTPWYSVSSITWDTATFAER